MNYLITPPSTHYDEGLGITACNFSSAADILKKHDEPMNEILPLCYLQRHAIELFLKSLIVILHKKYKLPYGLNCPAIKVNNKWVSLSKTHNISDLYNYFISIYEKVMDKLPETTSWELPSDINNKIKLISGSDPKSTYFRYPESSNSVQDNKKSSIQQESVESLFEKIENSKEPVKCVLMYDQNDNLVESYNMKSTTLPKILKALEDLNKFFYNMHAAFRFELTKGS